MVVDALNGANAVLHPLLAIHGAPPPPPLPPLVAGVIHFCDGSLPISKVRLYLYCSKIKKILVLFTCMYGYSEFIITKKAKVKLGGATLWLIYDEEFGLFKVSRT